MSTLEDAADLGAGEWRAYLVDRPTGAERELERTGWRGNPTRAVSAVSTASVVLDPDYARRLALKPVLWANELLFRRDGLLAWVGPVTSIDDSSAEGVAWNAEDRMAAVLGRRWFWRNATYAGESTRLFEFVLDAADFGDPTYLRRDPRPNGLISSLRVVAGDKTGTSVTDLAAALEWTVIGDTVRYGEINASAQLVLPVDSWGPDRPALSADGYQRLSHVCAVTDGGYRVFFPSADPNDREPGSPLLVDTVDVGNVSPGEAAAIARRLWYVRQGELAVVPGADRPLDGKFPLRWPELVPGATMFGSVRGDALFSADVPIRVESVAVDLADGHEVVSAGLGEALGFDPNVANFARVLTVAHRTGGLSGLAPGVSAGPEGGLIFFEDNVFPDQQEDADDWTSGDWGYDPSDPSDPDFDWGGGGIFDPGGGDLGGIGDYWTDPGGGSFDPGDFGGGSDWDLGGGSGAGPGFDPVTTDGDSFVPDEFGGGGVGGDWGGPGAGGADPYADCPPSHCCDLCSTGETASAGGFVMGPAIAYQTGPMGEGTVQFSAGPSPAYDVGITPAGNIVVHDMVLRWEWGGAGASGVQPLQQFWCSFTDSVAGSSTTIDTIDLIADPYFVLTRGAEYNWYLNLESGEYPMGSPPNLSGLTLGRLRVTCNRAAGSLLFETAPNESDAFETWFSIAAGYTKSFSHNIYMYQDNGNDPGFPLGSDIFAIAAHSVTVDGVVAGYADGETLAPFVNTPCPEGLTDLSGPDLPYYVSRYEYDGETVQIISF